MTREELVERARLLSIVSIVLSGVLGGFAVAVGLLTSRLSLLGFGFDAAIDSIASIVLVWRFRLERDHPARAERAERLAERVIGGVLIVLAVYLAANAVNALATGSRPATTTAAILISIASIAFLPPLALLKYRVARALGSGALRADSILTAVGGLLAFFSVIGFVLTEAAHLTWADSVMALLVAAVLLREGTTAFRRSGLSG